MGILGEDDVEMNEESTLKIKKRPAKKGIKSAEMKGATSILKEKSKKIKKKGGKAPELQGKVNKMKEMAVLKNNRWMRAVKEVSQRKNLIPIHQELLAKIVGRTCLPMHKERFKKFLENSLKYNKEKYERAVEDLFGMLKKNMKRISQSPELRKAAEAPPKIKKPIVKKTKSSVKKIDTSSLTKSQRKRIRRKERQALARAKENLFTAEGDKKGKKKESNKKNSKAGKSKKPKKEKMEVDA